MTEQPTCLKCGKVIKSYVWYDMENDVLKLCEGFDYCCHEYGYRYIPWTFIKVCEL